MRNAVLALPFLVFLPLCAAAEDPLQLLQKAAANYAALSRTTYDFEQVELREFSNTQTQTRRRVAGSGNKYREETLPSGLLYIFDGQHRWAYNPARNEYTKTSVRGSAGRPASLAAFQIAAFRVKNVRLLRTETLALASGPVACQVIEVEREPTNELLQYSPTTYWIDTSRSLILKSQVSYTSGTAGKTSAPGNVITYSFTKAAIGQPADESLFRFTPPADAVLVERLSFGPKSSMIGENTPDFELLGVDGTVITSAALRGNPVLLQFGTGPGDESLLLVEMTYRALKGGGLAVVCVLPSWNQSRAAVGLYTLPFATDSGGKAARQFGITDEGAVLIDRFGKIRYADVIFRNSGELARALQKIGAW